MGNLLKEEKVGYELSEAERWGENMAEQVVPYIVVRNESGMYRQGSDGCSRWVVVEGVAGMVEENVGHNDLWGIY